MARLPKYRLGSWTRDWKESWPLIEMASYMKKAKLPYSVEVEDTGADFAMMLMASWPIAEDEAQVLFDSADLYIGDKEWHASNLNDLFEAVARYGAKKMEE